MDSNFYNQDLTKFDFLQNIDPVSLLATSLPDLETDLGSSIMEMANFRLFREELSNQMIPASNASTPSPLISNATHCFSPLANQCAPLFQPLLQRELRFELDRERHKR